MHIIQPVPPRLCLGALFFVFLRSRTCLSRWVDSLVSQSSSPGGEKSRKKETDSLFRNVFIACESLGATEAESLCADLHEAVTARGIGVE